MIQHLYEFESALEDDTVFDSSGYEPVIPGGQNILELIREKLMQMGYEVPKGYQRSFYGWETVLRAPEGKVMLIVQEGKLLSATLLGRWLGLVKDRAFFSRFLGELEQVLHEAGPFRNIRSYTRREFLSPKRKGA